MTTFNNWRFNPFTGTTHATPITAELHDIEYQDEWNAYGIQLDEAPESSSPSTVEIIDNDTLVAFTEVPRSVAPSAGQFRVDYDASTFYGTGRIQFNAADTGKTVSVNYYGTGTVVKNNYRQLQVTTFPTTITFEEDATFDQGMIKNNADISIRNDNSRLIDDNIFSKGYWKHINTLSDWVVPTTVDDTANGGSLTTLRCEDPPSGGFDVLYYAPFSATATPTIYFTPALDGKALSYGDSISVLLRVRRTVSFTGSLDVQIYYFDGDSASLGFESRIIDYTDMATTYKDFVLSYKNTYANTVYACFYISATTPGAANYVYISRIEADVIPIAGPEPIKNQIISYGYASTFPQYPTNSSGVSTFIPIYDGIYNLTGSYADYDIDGTEAFPWRVKSVLIRYFCDHSGASAVASNAFRDVNGNVLLLGMTVNATGVNDAIECYGFAIVNVYSYTVAGKANLSGLKNGTTGSFYVHGFFI